MKNIKVLLGDISKLNCEAIVNAAKDTLLGGGGVDAAIHKVAGPQLLEECRTLNGCELGKAKITKGYNLKAKYVIHTVGPVYFDGNSNEAVNLASCYKSCFELCLQNNIKSIAFPCISTGNYSFPHQIAAEIAVKEIKNFLAEHPDIEVIICCYLERDYNIYKFLLEGSIWQKLKNMLFN